MKRIPEKQPATPEFAQLVQLLSIFSDADSRLREIEADANGKLLELLDDKRSEYAQLQEAMTKAETALETICRSHPEWFQTAKSVKTPYGKVQFHRSTQLESTNPEATVKLLEAEAKVDPVFPVADYIRTAKEPNIEALEALPDADLERFMLHRVKKDNFSVTAAKVDFGKAVAAAAEADTK